MTFYLLLGFLLLFLNKDLSKAIITLMNIIVVLTPLIGTIFGVMYYYSSREFTQLLLSQPLKRSTIFTGQYLGIASSLSLSLILGLLIPFLFYGLLQSFEIFNFAILLVVGAFLSFIFVAIAFNICIINENKIMGFGYAILTWLFLAVVYDGLLLILLMIFQDYPLDKLTLILISLNPIDLSRIIILLKLDISALMGYTGAVFNSVFGSVWGIFVSLILLIAWVVVPWKLMVRLIRFKDF